ncbi:MAG: CDP-alcohol phosphatidyltransferase family protein, partial [bacterium]|nr:CDP-alcohol phosphatidyltransferase family protein [bacterium]
LKDIAVEEIVDLCFFRPIAYLMVKLIYPLPLTPNQISILSMVAGITGAFFFAQGDRKSFLIAGLLYALAHILDCCDGMIARLKKNGSLIGRIIDGWADYVTSISTYTGLLIGLSKGGFDLPTAPWILMLPAAFSLGIHCMMVDYYRHEFMAHALGKANSIRQDLALYGGELERLKKLKGRRLEKIMITAYIGYTKLQLNENADKGKYNREEYYKANRMLLLLWNWIGLSTHIFVLILSSILYNPMIFFYYIIVAANVWMLIIGFIQVRANKKIALQED